MKRNFFKIVLPVFAFMLAIAFSFATQAYNDMDYFGPKGYVQIGNDCIEDRDDCSPVGSEVCTQIFPGTLQVFKKNGSCDIVLYMP